MTSGSCVVENGVGEREGERGRVERNDCELRWPASGRGPSGVIDHKGPALFHRGEIDKVKGGEGRLRTERKDKKAD